MKKLYFLVGLLCIFSFAQAQHTVSGVVTDDTGETLIGVSILEKGTSNGATTDVVGAYKITIASGSATLIVSYVGYETQEITLTGQSNLNITLEADVKSLGEVLVVGSRNSERSAVEAPVPIDVIDASLLTTTTGRVDMNQLLQYAAPSFNATKQSGSDGADHIDPASLRGLGPDQTLVLVNGKRRHQSSLINVFGTRGRGNTGTDLNAIPVYAIKRIEVLRDGASAQYGSDAIAGVINIVLKDETDGLTGGITYGAYSTNVGEGYAEESGETLWNVQGMNRLDGEERRFDGNTTKLDLNYGVGLGKDGGFINFSSELLSKQRTLRPGFSWRKGYGSAAVDQFQFMVNAAVPLTPNTELYAFGGRGDRGTDAFAFSRGAPGIDGDERAVPSLYPDGFTPRITSKIIDHSVTAGLRHKMDNGWNADLSHTVGYNNFHYLIKNTNNASMGAASPTSFDAGGHSLGMQVTSLDFSQYFDDVASGLNVAFGTEFRAENFQIFAGEVGSYATYDTLGFPITNPAVQVPYTNEFGQQAPGGSQGFPGYSPSNAIDENRTNFGVYGDAEINLTDEFLLTGALRFERYSDFGNTFNYKLATRYALPMGLSLRASVSSGFRAPSLAQIHYNLVFNNIVAGTSVRTLLASNTSTVAKSFGIGPLKQETAQNFAAGVTYKVGGLTATVDGYLIDVRDRIILTDYFDASALGIGVEAAQFFANGVDTRTTGLDIILNYTQAITNTSKLTAGIAGNFNNTEILAINSGDLNPLTFFGPFSQAYLEAAAPDYKVSGMLSYTTSKLTASVVWTQYSSVLLQDFQWVDSPPTTQAEADALYAVATDVYEAAGTLDLSVSYRLRAKTQLTIGANNILNTYPTPQFDAWTDQGGFNDSVQMGADGAYFFARIGFGF